MNTARVKNGRVRFYTEVDIDTTVDVDVDVKLSDVMDDIIDSLDDDQAELIAEKAGLNKVHSLFFEGDGFKRHLCDVLSLGYHSDKVQILNEINNRLI